MARGYKTGGRTAGTPNRRTRVLAEFLRQEGLKARADAPDGPELAPLEIMVRCANRLYSKAVAARAKGDFVLEEMLLKAAAAAAEKAGPYKHAKLPTVVVGPDSLPSLRRMSIKQLQQLLVDLEDGEYTDITDRGSAEGRAQERTPPLEGPQAQPRSGPSNGSRPRR